MAYFLDSCLFFSDYTQRHFSSIFFQYHLHKVVFFLLFIGSEFIKGTHIKKMTKEKIPDPVLMLGNE